MDGEIKGREKEGGRVGKRSSWMKRLMRVQGLIVSSSADVATMYVSDR